MFKKIIFNKIHTGNLVYNTCWEDPRCDRALLGLDAQSKVVMLTSAGCNALDYLLDNPASIDCVDMNPRQNALLDLKSALIQNGYYHELFGFFGQGHYDGASEIFHDSLWFKMDGFARTYWQKNIANFFKGTGMRSSFYWHGSAGTVAFLVKKFLDASPSTRRLVYRLFECDDLDQQRVLYYRLEPRLLNLFLAWLLNQHVVQSMLGVPESQQVLARQAFKDGMTGYIRHCFRKVFVALPLADNYFWKLYFWGHYSKECCPNYLRRENFSVLQQRVGRIATHTTTLSQFLQEHPGQYTHFVLLDHQDWLARNDQQALAEEWELILQNSAPEAKVLLRSAAKEIAFIPDFAHQNLRFEHEKTAEWHQKDRVGTYASVHLGIRV